MGTYVVIQSNFNTCVTPKSLFLVPQFNIFMCLQNKPHSDTFKLSVKYSHLSTHLSVRTDTRDDRDTTIPRHYRYHVAGYKKEIEVSLPVFQKLVM